MSGAKLVRRLREHDWLAAAIEFVIVVAGILLALQVSNWNQDRVDRGRGARFEARLREELITDRQRAAGISTSWGRTREGGRRRSL